MSKTWRASLGIRASAPRRTTDADAPAARAAILPVPDRAEREAAAEQARRAFCARLRAARERSGISLEALAQASKVSASHFVALESNDLARWPGGIYRRAFFRAYAAAIGLPVDSTVDEFLSLFPDDPGQAAEAAPGATAPLRLTLAGRTRPRFSKVHLLAALSDAAIVLVASSVLAWLANLDLTAAIALVALAYYGIATILAGTTPVAWWLAKGSVRARRLRILRRGDNRGAHI